MKKLDIALIYTGESYKFDDYEPLARADNTHMRIVQHSENWGNPDLLILPGTEDVAADYDLLEQRGLIELIHQHAQQGGWVLGICGGMHMMSRQILDPKNSKYPFTEKKMLGLLALDTHYGQPPVLARLRKVQAPWGHSLRGYETHRGQVRGEEPILFTREDGSAIGYGHGHLLATYLHRCFDNQEFLTSFLHAVRNNIR